MKEKITPVDDLITVDLDGYLEAEEHDSDTETFDLDGKKVD